MGFDVCHLNLHKTFATPTAAAAGGPAPGGVQGLSGPFLPAPPCAATAESTHRPGVAFHANFLVVVKALAYLLRLGHRRGRGRPHGGAQRQLSQRKLEKAGYTAAFPGLCMHEFVLTLEELKKETGYPPWTWPSPCWTRASTRPPCISPDRPRGADVRAYGPSPRTLDEAAAVLAEDFCAGRRAAGGLHAAPASTPVGRPTRPRRPPPGGAVRPEG